MIPVTVRFLTAALAALLFSSLLFTGAATAEQQSLDTGYRPWINGFSFQNAGDPEAFFGFDLNGVAGTNYHDEIFRHTGHCFGMAQASVDDFLANRTSADESRDAAMPRIDHIQTEQSFYYVADYAVSPLGGSATDNSAEYEKILDRLSTGKPAVLGVYYSAGGHPGHAVVAYRAELEENKTLLYVYDPNLPPALYDYRESPAVAVFYPATGAFSYDNGQVFDQVRLDDVSQSGVERGRTLVTGIVSFPAVAIFIAAVRRFPPGL